LSQVCSSLPEYRGALLQKWIGSWNGFLESLNGLNGHAALLSCCHELNVGFLFYQRHFDMSTGCLGGGSGSSSSVWTFQPSCGKLAPGSAVGLY